MIPNAQGLKRVLPPWLLGVWQHRLVRYGDFLRVRQEFTDNPLLVNRVTSIWSACWPRKTILFFPEGPLWGSVEYKLCALLGHAITTNPREEFDVAFKRKDATYFDPAVLNAIPSGKSRIINAQSVDISKRTLDKAFSDVFGYELEVDPTRHDGRIVEKSNENSAHDGQILRGPIPAEEVRPGCVYQKLIGNSSDMDGLVLDYRLPVYGDEMPLVYLKYRTIETRFSNVNAFVKLGEPRAMFSRAELANILLLARRMGIDYGEFDVLRDSDGQVYVVDANNTPYGPPNGLPAPESKEALERLAQSFDFLLERWSS